MKIKMLLGVALVAATVFISCSTIARAAAKYWTNKQIKEFISNCSQKAGKIVGEAKADKYCDCAVDIVAEQYRNYQDARNINIYQILKIADGCR